MRDSQEQVRRVRSVTLQSGNKPSMNETVDLSGTLARSRAHTAETDMLASADTTHSSSSDPQSLRMAMSQQGCHRLWVQSVPGVRLINRASTNRRERITMASAAWVARRPPNYHSLAISDSQVFFVLITCLLCCLVECAEERRLLRRCACFLCWMYQGKDQYHAQTW